MTTRRHPRPTPTRTGAPSDARYATLGTGARSAALLADLSDTAFRLLLSTNPTPLPTLVRLEAARRGLTTERSRP